MKKVKQEIELTSATTEREPPSADSFADARWREREERIKRHDDEAERAKAASYLFNETVDLLEDGGWVRECNVVPLWYWWRKEEIGGGSHSIGAALRVERIGNLQADVEALRKLVIHMRVHEGYKLCGYNQMTTEQRALFDALWAQETN